MGKTIAMTCVLLAIGRHAFAEEPVGTSKQIKESQATAVAAGIGAGLIVAELKDDTRKERLERVAVYAAMGTMISERLREEEAPVNEPDTPESSEGTP